MGEARRRRASAGQPAGASATRIDHADVPDRPGHLRVSLRFEDDSGFTLQMEAGTARRLLEEALDLPWGGEPMRGKLSTLAGWRAVRDAAFRLLGEKARDLTGRAGLDPHAEAGMVVLALLALRAPDPVSGPRLARLLLDGGASPCVMWAADRRAYTVAYTVADGRDGGLEAGMLAACAASGEAARG